VNFRISTARKNSQGLIYAQIVQVGPGTEMSGNSTLSGLEESDGS
jgi:hypothetical protein